MSKPTVLMIGAYPQWDMEPMERDYDVHKLWLAADKEAFLDMAAPHARAIATGGELGASAALIDKCPKLELIACYGVGVDAIDLAKARARSVRVTNTPDVLVAAVAGGEATRNMVDADVFEALGPSGLFVNVSRGSVVDEPALVQALAQRRIGGACLDVFWNEPNVDRRFLEFDNRASARDRRAPGLLATPRRADAFRRPDRRARKPRG